MMAFAMRKSLFPLLCIVARHVRYCHAERKYTPRRAMMYVPGNDQKKLSKITSLDVDCACMDCEDGVALNRKEEARNTVRQMLDELKFGRTECAVRVNSVSSGLAEEDLNIVLQAKKRPATMMLPKVEEPSELECFSEKLRAALKGSTLKEKINLVIYVETAVGLLNLRDTCQRGTQLSKEGADFHLDGIVFGSDDFCASIGASRTEDARELLYARQKVVVTAKAYGLQAIDLVHINFKDLDGLRQQSLEGAKMGFTGKQVIHPSQVPVVQESFTPTPERVQWATDMIEAFEHHQKTGKGAFTFQGSMIDMPSVLQARNIVQMMDKIRAGHS